MRIDNNFVAVVTGGSSGLGEATAKLLASLGAKIVVADMNQELGQVVAKDVNGVFFKVNVVSQENVKQLFQFAKATYGKVDAVVHCAGVFYQEHLISPEGVASTLQFIRVMNINIVGSFNVSKFAAKVMSEQPEVNGERGVIILVSSVAAEQGASNQVAYGASKGAINAMVLPMARDLAKHKIRVMTIAPGLFTTPMHSGLQKIHQMYHIIPAGRFGQSQQFAHLSKSIIQNAYATGTVWRLDGGLRGPFV